MYNQFYALEQRPFSTTPNPNCFFPTESIQTAQQALLRSIEEGQGLAVVTSAPGLGKTLLLRKIESMVSDRFATVMLSLSGYSTRSDFLQALLFEFNQPYSQMGEQELRLKLLEAAQQVMDKKEGTVILVDEAHLLNDRLLDELRALTNYALGADPLFRIVLAGQLKLEERLTSPALEAINQRLSCQQMLERLSVQESYDYIAHRVAWSGGEIELCFSDRALDLIVKASDGSPRCISALCDHSLLLSFVSEDKPVTSEIVYQALEDLQKLPLQWTIPQQISNVTTQQSETGISEETVSSYETSLQNDQDAESVEVVPEVNSNDGESYSFEIGADVVEEIEEELNEELKETSDDTTLEEELLVEESVLDEDEEIEMETYSLMDERAQRNDENEPKVSESENHDVVVEDIIVEDTYAKLDYMNQFQKKNSSPVDSSDVYSIQKNDSKDAVLEEDRAEVQKDGFEEIENQIGLAIHEIQDETRSVIENRSADESTEVQSTANSSQTIRYDVVQPVELKESGVEEKDEAEKRPYKNLFTEMNKQIDDVLGTN